MSFITLSLPDRAIAVSVRPFVLPRRILYAILVMLTLAGGIMVWQGPGLWRDIQISQNPVTLRNGEVLDGKCTTRRGITDCGARLVYHYNGVDYDTYVEMAFVDFSSSTYAVRVVVLGDSPELATISLGLEMLWNRLIVFGIFMLFLLGGPIVLLFQAVGSLHGNSALRMPSALVDLVPVNIIARDKQHFSYRGDRSVQKSKSMICTVLDKGQEPLLTVNDKGQTVAVTARFKNSALPVLLDSELKRLDLTEEERRVALETFEKEKIIRSAALLGRDEDLGKTRRCLGLLQRLGIALAVIVLLLAAGLAYWFYYVTSSSNRFDGLGMEINNILPEPLNAWGCQQLHARFGREPAPFGCAASDFMSWKETGTGQAGS